MNVNLACNRTKLQHFRQGVSLFELARYDDAYLPDSPRMNPTRPDIVRINFIDILFSLLLLLVVVVLYPPNKDEVSTDD